MNVSIGTRLWRFSLLTFVCLAVAAAPLAAQAFKINAEYLSAYGWVKPGDAYPFFVNYEAGEGGISSATIQVTMPASAVFVSSNPAPASGDGSATSPLTFNLGALPAGSTGQILINARAKNLDEDPEVMWKDLSATATATATVLDVVQPSSTATTLGPKVTTQQTARYGVRRFPLVMVQYQDIKRCNGVGDPYEECTGDHTAEALDEAVNSRTSGKSLWQLYNDMSFGQLSPVGSVRPAPGSTAAAFDTTYPHKWSKLQPRGTCNGTTVSDLAGTASYPNRIDNGWYVLPGTQGYYGSDSTGHALLGAYTGIGLLFGVDDGCGPTAKITYDAASIADPDLDYNDFDTDKDGWVDFFNVAFAGEGGNGNISVTGVNNVWPHKSDLRYYFRDENGETGYVSNDQLRSHTGQPMYWTDATRTQMTTDPSSGIKVFVRVGPYNVNPEAAIEKMSVIAHEYGHSLGLPDFYSFGSRGTMGSWELMGSDHAQYMTVFTRQDLGWIVPRQAEDAVYTLRESKTDTNEIHWKRPDGTPYTLTGPGIHNADAIRVALPAVKLIEQVPSGTRAWHSGAGNDFGCAPEAGHNLDFYLPDLVNHPDAQAITLRFQSLYEIEWDWDYGFVLASIDGGQTWASLASNKKTTLSGFSPNAAECYNRHQNGITGVSGLPNELTTSERLTNSYPEAQWIEDEFDLTQFAGQQLLLRFTYFTDPAVVKRGWFIDDINISADGVTVYTSDFEQEEGTRIFPTGWSRVSSADGVALDHSYYVELRDRTSWDKDGKLQSERGAPTWEPGVAILYTDENHGYGNTGAENQPAQTVVDSRPDPGNENPNLDDAAFTVKDGRTKFDGCTHVDNYLMAGDVHWKLPNGVTLRVENVSGLSTDGSITPATATVIVDVQPDCSILEVPPTLAFGAGHEDPDTDGTFELTWQRPGGAVGPDQVQEATVYGLLLTDDAENGMSKWTVSNTKTGMVDWQPSPVKSHSGTYGFYATATDTAKNGSSIMTLATPLEIPAAGTTTLSFWDWFAGELDDQGFVEVSADGGTTWEAIYQTSHPTFADENVYAIEAPMAEQRVNLAPFAGSTVQLRFRYYVNTPNYIFYHPVGWSVDDIQIDTANWYDVATVDGTSVTRTDVVNGTYFYRVRTNFPAGVVNVPSPWSNVITTAVSRAEPPPTFADLTVSSITASSRKGANKPTTITAVVTNAGENTAAASVTEFRHDSNVIGSVSTPALAPGGSIEVTVQWYTKDLDGPQTVTVSADSAAEVIESDETNNSSSSTLNYKNGKLQ